jgi:ADP-ribose pyrophosphatase YjhB (NUDIX family)
MPEPSDALTPARDGEEVEIRAGGQAWLVSWHPPMSPPPGKPHGASGVCVTADGGIVLISTDGHRWGLPGGRPEGDETWEETFRREMLEEACATVVDARLLGFGRSRCIAGHEAGLVIVRSWWRADVELARWEPQFEIPYRRVFAAEDVRDELDHSEECGLDRVLARMLREAGLTP